MPKENGKMPTGSGIEFFLSSGAVAFQLCRLCCQPNLLASGQKIACKRCSVAALEYRYSGCGLNKKKQHRAGLLAPLKIKLVV